MPMCNYACACINTRMHSCMCVRRYVCMAAHIYSFVHTYVCVCTETSVCARMRIGVHQWSTQYTCILQSYTVVALTLRQGIIAPIAAVPVNWIRSHITISSCRPNHCFGKQHWLDRGGQQINRHSRALVGMRRPLALTLRARVVSARALIPKHAAPHTCRGISHSHHRCAANRWSVPTRSHWTQQYAGRDVMGNYSATRMLPSSLCQ